MRRGIKRVRRQEKGEKELEGRGKEERGEVGGSDGVIMPAQQF